MIFRQGPQNIISCLGAVSPEGKALYVAAQQPLQRRKVASVIIRRRDLRHDLNSVLPCVDNAVLNARCDLLLEVRLTERHQNADLVFPAGEVKGPSQRIRLEVHLLHHRPDPLCSFRLHLSAVMQDTVHRSPGYAGLFRYDLDRCHTASSRSFYLRCILQEVPSNCGFSFSCTSTK